MINHLANIAGIAVLKDHEYILKTLEVIPTLRLQLCEALKEIPHVKVFDSQANYLFFKYDDPEIDLKQKLIEHGIMIRSCSNYHGLDTTYYRIAVKSHEANEKFIEAMKNIECSS